MTVRFYSPLPPARTGVADYAAALLAELRRHGRVELGGRQAGGIGAGRRAEALGRHQAALYHLGNNALHAGVYRQALAEPGVVVLHDAVLHHFLLGQLDEPAYVEEFVYNYGEWNRGLASELWRGRAGSAADRRYFDYPMLRRVAERAHALVVHNPAAARAVKDHAPAARVVEIPHLFQDPALTPAPSKWPGEAEVLRYRQRLGVEPVIFLFGVFGYLRESKRLVAVLETFRTLHRENARTGLLIAGQFVSMDLERAVRPMLAAPGVVRLPHLREREFWMAARAVDACINLKYPAAGETSGIGIRLMGIGKPVMVTDGPECSRFLEDACLRIAPGASERESLLRHMVLLTSMSGVASAIGDRGAGYIRAHHRIDQIGRQYWDLLNEARD